MRELSATLKKAQQAGALNPLYKVVLTKGESSYTYEQDRILPSEHDESQYSHTARVVLHNRDHEFDDKDLKGYDAVISYGFGKEYSATAPLVVIDHQFDSDPNNLICTLELEGMPNLMAKDNASEAYIPDEDDTKTVKQLVEAIVGASLAPFTHCHAFEVVWNEGYDTLADNYKPRDSFRIYNKGSRLAALRRVLDFTANVPRFEADGKVHIMKPVTSGESFDAEYSLEQGQHQFFSKAYKETLVFPNRFVVASQPDDDPQYSGEATVDGYDSLPSKVKKTEFIQLRLESNEQAASIATALIAKAEMGAARGQAEIRINCGSEVFDYVKVTDSRQGDTRTGNLGYIHRRFGKDKWTMTFGFGNWLEMLRYRNILNELETYTDAGQYFSRLSVGDLYAEHLLAENMDFVWLDPDNTIDLSKIGDDLDGLPDGETYVRTRTLHLDASGVYIQENMLYTLRVPGVGDNNLWKSTTAPASPSTGDYWLDLNYTPNKVKKWTGSAWEEVSAEELALLNSGTVVRRLKGVSLTADGLVVLDEVQVGTYDLMLATDISAGHALLSKTVKDGKWYEESGVVLDATLGIALYGGEGINAFRTFATKAHYEAGTPVQIYIGTDGKLYTGNMGVILDQFGAEFHGESCLWYGTGEAWIGSIYGSSTTGFHLVSTDKITITASGDLCLEPISGGKVILYSDFNPVTDNAYSLGSPSKPFYGGYFASRLRIPAGVDMYD